MLELFTLGSKDNEEGTETSALFAGTGSDVKMPKKLRKNRFDEIQERREREREDKEDVERTEGERRQAKTKQNQDVVGEEEGSMDLDSEELERMKEFARQLSRKIEVEKKQRELSLQENKEAESEKVAESHAVVKQGETALIKGGTEEKGHKGLPTEQNDIDYNRRSDIHLTTQSVLQTDGTSSDKLNAKSHNWKQNGKLWTIPIKRKQFSTESHIKKEEESNESSKDFSKSASSSHVSETGRSEKPSPDEDKELKLKRHKRKRKHHDASKLSFDHESSNL